MRHIDSPPHVLRLLQPDSIRTRCAQRAHKLVSHCLPVSSVCICLYFCPLISGCAYLYMHTYQCKGGGGEGMNSFPGVSHRTCRLVMSHKSTAIFLRSALSEGEPLQGMPFRAFHRLSGCWKQSNSHTLY
jgi:hypothetical protein